MRPDIEHLATVPPTTEVVAALVAEVRRLKSALEAPQPTLTDDERLAVDAAAHAVSCLYAGPEGVTITATLRGLLERAGGKQPTDKDRLECSGVTDWRGELVEVWIDADGDLGVMSAAQHSVVIHRDSIPRLAAWILRPR